MTIIVGILTIIFGFAAPFLSRGELPPILFFWIGFLLLLRPSKYFRSTSEWPNWARIGLFIHILGSALILLYSYILIYTFLSRSDLAGLSLRLANSLINPISSLITYLFPYPHFIMPDGAVQIHISFIRGTLTSFLDVSAYLVFAVIAGKLINSYSKRISLKESLW